MIFTVDRLMRGVHADALAVPLQKGWSMTFVNESDYEATKFANYASLINPLFVYRVWIDNQLGDKRLLRVSVEGQDMSVKGLN